MHELESDLDLSYSQDHFTKASGIKVLISDVDGVMTNGSITYDDTGRELKSFNVKDGLIVKYLRENNILVGVITGRSSEIVKRRCEELKFDFHLHGVQNKMEALRPILQEYSLTIDEVAYLGDDLNDLSVLTACGLSMAPSDAPQYIKEEVDIVSAVKGGEGVFREMADLLLLANNKLRTTVEKNLK